MPTTVPGQEEETSLLGGKPARDQGSQPTRLVDEYAYRKSQRDATGRDPARHGFSFLKVAKRLRDEQGGGFKIDKELAHDDDIVRKCNYLVVLAVLSVALYVVHMEINFNSDGRYMENDTRSSYVMRFLMTFVTAVLLCCLIDYYQLCVYLYRRYQTPNTDELQGWWPRQWVYTFAVEVLVCLVHPVPGLINNKVGAFILLRLYLLLNLVRNNSEIFKKRGLVYNSGHLKRGGDRVDLTLCLKIQIDESPALCLSVFAVVVLVVVSYANYICEREGLNGAELTYWMAAWNASFLLFRGVSRVTTDSTAGRAIELATGLVGVLVLAVVVAIVTESMNVSETEQFARTWMSRHKSKKKAKTYAAELIQAAWRLHQLNVKCPEEVTMEVQLFFGSLIEKHARYREDCESQQNLSLDLCHDKVLAISREISGVEQEVHAVKREQNALLSSFDEIDDHM